MDYRTRSVSIKSFSHNILGIIFSFLSHQDLCRISLTCKKFRQASQQDFLWSKSKDIGSGSQKRRAFMIRKFINRNIFEKKPQTISFVGHGDTITSISSSQTSILTTSKDGTARIWDTQNFKGKILQGHTNSVEKGYIWGEKSVTVSADKTIRIWKQNKALAQLRGHSAAITCSKIFKQNFLATGSFDKSIKIWNLKKRKLVKNFDHFNTWVSKLDVGGGKIVSFSQEGSTINIGNLVRVQWETQIQTPRQFNGRRITINHNQTRSLLLENPLLYSGENNSVRIWDLRTPSVVDQLEVPYTHTHSMLINQQSSLRGVFKLVKSDFKNQLLVGCSGLSGLYIFDLRKSKKAFYEATHQSQIQQLSTGTNILKNLAVTSGNYLTSSKAQISVHNLEKPRKFSKIYPGHSTPISCLHLTDTQIISGSIDGSLYSSSFKAIPQERFSNKIKRILSR